MCVCVCVGLRKDIITQKHELNMYITIAVFHENFWGEFHIYPGFRRQHRPAQTHF